MAVSPPAASAGPHAGEMRTAILSIAGFWMFYFAIVSVRAAIMGFDDQGEMMVRRAIVSLVGAGLSFGFFWSLRPFAGRSLPVKVAAAAVLALPFSTLFGGFNYAAFYVYEPLGADRGGPAPRAMPDNRWGEASEAPDMKPAAAIADETVKWYFYFAAWAALFLALGYARDAVEAERTAQRYRSAARDAEIRALRYQVNPHFLFNTLNSLSTLVMRNRPEEAERMILNLSTFFRTSLTADPAQDLSLDEELKLQRLYLDIEAVRFPERLRVRIALAPGTGNACIPGMLLQPLIENAIKHGVSRAARPVTLEIRATSPAAGRLEIVVANDGPCGQPDPADTLFEPAPAGTGTGLRNVRDRLAARFGADASITWGPRAPEGYAAVVDLPLVRHGC